MRKSVEDVIANGVTAEEVRDAIERANIRFLGIHKCSMCGYQCGYVIERGSVRYDSGCYCMRRLEDLRASSWEDIADHLNMQRGSFEGIHWRERLWRAYNGETVERIALAFAESVTQ